MTNKIAKLSGSIVAVVTPFTNDNSIDYQAYSQLLDFHLQNNTAAILVCGTTGETPTLTESEYKGLISFTVEKISGRIPVIAGSGSNSTAKTLQQSKTAIDQGVDGLLVVGPYYNKPTSQGFYDHFSHIAENVSIPIIIYNVPGRTGKNIPTPVLLKLANDHKNIVGVKEASGNINQITDIIASKPKNFKVFSGDDALAFSVITLGGDGCISVVANQIPQQFSQLLSQALKGKLSVARKLHYRYLKLMNLNFIESNPIPVKTALYKMGYIKQNFRLPMCRMQSDNKRLLYRELKSLKLIK